MMRPSPGPFRPVALALGVLSLGSLCAASASAQVSDAAPPEAPPAPTPADPAALKAEASDAMRAGDCETAAAKFDALAAAIGDDPADAGERLTARFLAGVCYDRLGKLPEAAEALREVVNGDAPPELVSKAEPILFGIEQLLPVQVAFVCEEPDVDITLEAFPDDIKPCDEPWLLPAGLYRGAASAPDGREAVLSVRVTAGVPEEVVVLMPAVSPRKLVEAAPPPAVAPARSNRMLEWTLTAGAVAAIGGGVAFNIAAHSAVERGDEAYGRYERARAVYDDAGAAAARVEVEDARDDADTAAVTSYALLGVGAALTGLALWTWLDDPGPATAGEVEAAVVPGPTGIGVVGRW